MARRRIRKCLKRKRGKRGIMKCALFSSHGKVYCLKKKRTRRGKRCAKYARRRRH